ncbi:polyprenyl glycosylphosphotransferase [Knoellia aerolata DSM 18566]|uniref:Polyprenyl glycosylphosphotransferase n=2 Tax=Knoellia TaxID=136099 RepID=A0A0A0JYX2_9MICO|nr:polyprenyl glycosylphosphotransferase [Knoellia aerolata DSM 18566]
MAAFALDAAIVVLCTVLAAWGRSEWRVFTTPTDADIRFGLAAMPIVALWLTSLAVSGAYAPDVFGAGSGEYKSVLRATTYAAGFVGIGCYLARYPLPRGFFFLLFTVGTTALLVTRYAARQVLHRLREHGHLQQRVVIAGAASQVDEIAKVLQRERWLGYTVLGAVLPPSEAQSSTPGGLPVLGATPRTAEIVNTFAPHAVLFAGGAVSSAREMRRAAWELEESGVQVLLAPSLTDVASDRVRPRPAAGLPLIELEGPASHYVSHVLKRAFDLVAGGLLLVLFAPVFAVVALAVRLDDGGPVFFAQERVGKGGRAFRMLKFRSMVCDAEAAVDHVAEHNRHGSDHVLFKAERDPRVTRIGRTLRRLSLDELPQLVNVLRGDMSLVGPRPPLQSEVDKYETDVHRRLVVRPGMTGLWQVSGRSNLSWEDSVRLDLYYVDNWSLTQDLLILARTAIAVVSARGAY